MCLGEVTSGGRPTRRWTRQTVLMPSRPRLRTLALLLAVALVSSACSSEGTPRTVQEPVQDPSAQPELTTTTRDPSVGRSAGDPADASGDAAAGTPVEPVTITGAESVIHVLGSIRSIPGTVEPWDQGVPVLGADLATVASLSCTTADSCAPAAVAAWAGAPLELVNVATANGALDLATITEVNEALAVTGVRTVGFGSTAEQATAPVIVQNDDLAIAFHAISISAEAEIVATETSPGIAGPAQFGRLLERVAESRSMGYGVVVLVDWGSLDVRAPTDLEITAVEQLVEAGADAVVGHGSDFLQRFDQVGSAAVVYGLGNAVTENPDPLRNDSATLRLEFGRPGRSCLIPTTATALGPTQDDPSVADCSTS